MRDEFGEGATDVQLLAGVVDRDGGALRTLYERHSPWLTLRLSRRCADPGMVDEVVQDTFLAVWRKPESYRGKGEVAAWIWGIGIRRLIDALPRFDGRPSVGSSPCAMGRHCRVGNVPLCVLQPRPSGKTLGSSGGSRLSSVHVAAIRLVYTTTPNWSPYTKRFDGVVSRRLKKEKGHLREPRSGHAGWRSAVW